MTPDRHRLLISIAAAVGVVAYGGMLWLDATTGTLRAATTPSTIWFFGLALVGFAMAGLGGEGCHRFGTPVPLLWVWGPAVLFRLLLLPTEPSLSDDVFRYLWDGHQLTQGVNPFSHPISSPAVDHLEIPVRRLANNPDLASPYLPTTQLLFAAVVGTVGPSPTALQVVMAAADLVAAAILQLLLVRAGLPGHRVILYLWNPLVVVEAAHGAHFDSLMVALTLASILTAYRGPADAGTSPGWLSPVLLALATLTRPIPLLLAPVLWWRWSWAGRAAYALTLVAMVLPFSFGPARWGLFGPPTGAGVFGSSRIYSAEFRFNAVPATWLEGWFGPIGVPMTTLAPIVMGSVLSVVFISGRRRPGGGVAGPSTGRSEPAALRRDVRMMVVILGWYVILTPVLHPWYLIIVLALGVFVPPGPVEASGRWLVALPWWFLAAAVALSYLTYRDPDRFAELGWVRRVEWWPTLVFLALALGWWLLAGRRTPEPTRDSDQDRPRSVPSPAR